MKTKFIDLNDITWTIKLHPEYSNPRDHFDNPLDLKVVLSGIEDNNEWAWCTVEVIGTYKGISANDFLGGCSYKSKKDFIESNDYYLDMQQNVLCELDKIIGDLQFPEYITDGRLSLVDGRLTTKQIEAAYKIRDLFEVQGGGRIGTNGNIQFLFKDSKCYVSDMGLYYEQKEQDNIFYLFEQISSALLLYRTTSLFECSNECDGQDFYKSNWTVTLTHKETGITFALGEWKGGANAYTPFCSCKELPKEYKRDIVKLLNLLVSNKCPIGYDGVVAGTVA